MGNSIPFHKYVELLQLFLAHRGEIVEKIQGQLNAQRQPVQFPARRFYKTPRGWVAISKDILTEVLGAGKDVRITGLRRVPAEGLSLMIEPDDCQIHPRRLEYAALE